MSAREFGEKTIQCSFLYANLLTVSLSTIIVLVFLLSSTVFDTPAEDIRHEMKQGFLLCIPLVAVSLLLSGSAREYLSLVSYRAKFGYSNELDAAIGFYNEETTTSIDRFLVVIYAVFWAGFVLSISSFMTIGLLLSFLL